MYIKSIVLDGFKSYSKRTEINDFDKEFNAITGFNGSGKSNVLDAICFVLGITNLTQVRAASLQDLVYKSGQAGVNKASVTITFDNRDRNASPMGYETYEEIAVTRQVVIGGKNKYMINGTSVTNKRVQDMFHSVQLNVNNPHFLIMQGRITKVLGMKPSEILSMLEEAAGTRIYELKRQESFRLIEKKDGKLKEIVDMLTKEIGPNLNRLREERSQYVEFQRVERELERCRKLYIAWKYVSALRNSEEAEASARSMRDQIAAKETFIADSQREIVAVEEQAAEIARKRDTEKDGEMEELERELKDAEKREHKLAAEVNGCAESIKAEEKAVERARGNVRDDERALVAKEKELETVGGFFEKLKELDRRDTEALAAAQETYQKISSGLLMSESGENATLEQQLMDAKQSATRARTEARQCEMTLEHNEKQLALKQREMRGTEKEYRGDSRNVESMEAELKKLQEELSGLNYEEGHAERLHEEKRELTKELAGLREKADEVELRHPRLRFEYQDPEPNFPRDSVKGLVCRLFDVREKRYAYALENAAGGKLYDVIVDTEKTGKKLLQRGRLQQRVTIIPLNKVRASAMDARTVKLAQAIGGAENVQPAMSLIDFPEEVRAAMTSIFGQIFVCKDMDTATAVAFNEGVRRKCVTLDGDTVDPSGTLSGGAASKAGPILLKLKELKVIQGVRQTLEQRLRETSAAISGVAGTAERYASLKRNFDLRNYEVGVIRQRLQQTTHHKVKEEVDVLAATIEGLAEKMEAAKRTEKESSERVKELELQLKNSSSIREKQLKEAEERMKSLKLKSEESRKEWQKRERESETLDLEIKELRGTIEAGKALLVTAEENLVGLRERAGVLEAELGEARKRVKTLQAELKSRRAAINEHSREIQALLARKDEIARQIGEAQLEMKKLNHEINSVESKSSDCARKIAEMARKYEWIEQDKAYFGEAGGMYDFSAMDPEETGRKVRQLESLREELGRNVNTRAMNLLDKEEEQYNELLKKKGIVENDKLKIIESIRVLDARKEETLQQAWTQVNRDFGSIFGSLLPGAQAKLQPPENQTVMSGLEVKVGFSGVWKESLGELSGGQRSLVALSLMLAMLLLKPAPLYILDEVDAALDLSHTENIGTMLKRHFKHSQFIVVSLKDGMFNNANVLFRTQFVDGASTISRTEKARSRGR